MKIVAAIITLVVITRVACADPDTNKWSYPQVLKWGEAQGITNDMSRVIVSEDGGIESGWEPAWGPKPSLAQILTYNYHTSFTWSREYPANRKLQEIRQSASVRAAESRIIRLLSTPPLSIIPAGSTNIPPGVTEAQVIGLVMQKEDDAEGTADEAKVDRRAGKLYRALQFLRKVGHPDTTKIIKHP